MGSSWTGMLGHILWGGSCSVHESIRASPANQTMSSDPDRPDPELQVCSTGHPYSIIDDKLGTDFPLEKSSAWKSLVDDHRELKYNSFKKKKYCYQQKASVFQLYESNCLKRTFNMAMQFYMSSRVNSFIYIFL